MQFLLKPLLSRRKFSALLLLLQLSIIWGFATLTGLAPSVCRASAMFSLLLISQMLYRDTNVYNTLAGAALLVLSVAPEQLFMLGFQLSYLAVIGIVYFQPKLEQLLYLPNVWVQKTWSLATVSMAAQLTTLPILLHYFHQFPTYFLFANLLIVPAISIILYTGLAVLLLQPLPFLGDWCSTLFAFQLDRLNQLSSFFQKLPYATIEPLYLSHWQMISCYLMLLFGIFSYEWKSKFLLKATLLLLLVCTGSMSWRSFQKSQQNGLLAYDIPKGSCICLYQGFSGHSLNGTVEPEEWDYFVSED
jgi:competence protein ComEC